MKLTCTIFQLAQKPAIIAYYMLSVFLSSIYYHIINLQIFIKMKDLKLSNEKKAKMIAEQCKPCTEDFYSGIYQGVLLTLNAEQKHVISVVQKMKDFLTSRTFFKKQIPKSMEHFKFILQTKTSNYLEIFCEYDLEFIENQIDKYFKEFPKS